MEANIFKTLPKKIDISCVRADVTMAELEAMADMARQYRFICCFALPCFTQWLVEAMKDEPDIAVGGTVSFPSGAETTAFKALQTAALIEYGCTEIDMVINIGALKSQMYREVYGDIRAVVEAANGIDVKTVLEVSYLTEDEICRGCELAAKAGAKYIKTGTGWAPKETNIEHVRLIRSAVGDDMKIKVAGGIRDLETILSMLDAGCDRFGIGMGSIGRIMRDAQAYAGVETAEA